MACYFTNQVPAQLDGLRLWNETTAYKDDVYLFLVKLDEEVARLHFPAFDTELNVLTQEQIIQVSRLKAFSRVRTTVSMAACGCPVCEKHQTLYQRDRPVRLRMLGKLMLCSFTNQVLAQPVLLEGKHGLPKGSSPFLTGSCSVLIVEQLVEVPTNVFQDRIQQRTLEQISDTPVPQVVVVLVEVFTHFSRDRVQQRFAELIFQILHGDILKYNKLATAEDAARETGWKLVHADVFRTPRPTSTMSITCRNSSMRKR